MYAWLISYTKQVFYLLVLRTEMWLKTELSLLVACSSNLAHKFHPELNPGQQNLHIYETYTYIYIYMKKAGLYNVLSIN